MFAGDLVKIVLWIFIILLILAVILFIAEGWGADQAWGNAAASLAGIAWFILTLVLLWYWFVTYQPTCAPACKPDCPPVATC